MHEFRFEANALTLVFFSLLLRQLRAMQVLMGTLTNNRSSSSKIPTSSSSKIPTSSSSRPLLLICMGLLCINNSPHSSRAMEIIKCK